MMTVILGGVAAGCSGGDDDGSTGDESGGSKAIGALCAKDGECATGSCTPSRVCSKNCDTHTDCGCPTGTTNGDILSGRCAYGCYEGICTVPCSSDIDCAGDTECGSGTSWDGCI